MHQKAVFLDRDGVLSHSDVVEGKPYAPTTLESFRILFDAYEATSELKSLGYLLIVVTNQPDVGAGKVSREVVEQMNLRLAKELPIDSIKVCFHSQTAGCSCRKPLPGMILAGANEFDIELDSSFMIGDRWSDIEAGKTAGCQTIFIDRQYTERPPQAPDFTVTSLAQAIGIVREAANAQKQRP